MESLTAGAVREYLAGIDGGASPRNGARLFDELQKRGAVSGSSAQPQLTAVGQHVLRELRLRAYRVDTLSLDHVSKEMAGVLQEIDDVAKTVEYFLAELGPVAPPAALPTCA